jgi:putative transposase
MGRKPRIWYEGAMYHITNRGNSRKNIFLDSSDRFVFLDKLRWLVEDHGLKIHAYCLMTNHYHLVIETDKQHIGDTMRALNTYYSKQHHIKYGTSGHLFQGRYRSVLVEKDAYLLEVSRYVHLNPVSAGLAELPEHYLWSSMRVYMGEGSQSSLVYRDNVLGYFSQDLKVAEKNYRRFVHAKLNNPDSLEGTVTYDDILGTDSFVSEVRERVPGTRE